MRIPGPPRAHVWAGLALALVGALVGGFAYTGDRAYHIVYVPVAFVGFALIAVGSLLAAWGQARKPRLAKAPRARSARAAAAEKEADLHEAATQGEHGRGARGKAGALELTVECRACRHVFTAAGAPPLDAICPQCGHQGRIERPAAD